MAKISDRGINMPLSPIRKLSPLAAKAKKEGKFVHQLNIGQPDIPTPEWAINDLKSTDFKVVEYSPSEGELSLREAFVEYYKKYDIEVTTDEMIITYGASEALMIVLLSCLNPWDEVIVPEPFYANYSSFAGAADITVKPISSSIESNFALPSIDEFEKLIGPRTKAILICSPNNPTGYTYSKDELEKLKKICLKYDLFLISDEVYREFYYHGEFAPSILGLKGVEDKTIMLDSASKRYSMCGVRVGAIVSKNKEVIQTALKFGQARLSPPQFGQVAVESALKASDTYYREVKEEYKKRKDVLIEELSKIEGVKYSHPYGAFYTVVELPIDDDEKFCSWILTDFDFEGETVMFAPGSGFYVTPGAGKREIRIAYVVEEEKLRRAMKCLREALKVYPGRISEQLPENATSI
ncbi:MAG: aspartate aminotransferase [Flavobacteriales bacterium]|nr:aspartate aminotransferase [Flavobacteriales bacterium]|tara:strand:+ start:1524 stop:2753 length:1230 start_codon:yes stop_codon:yes gene_type:complete